MGEIDEKPIEPVQVAVSLFEEKGDHQRKQKSPTKDSENEKEMDAEGLMRDLANCKLQLEAKEAAYKQALLKLDHYQKIADELSTLLKQSEDEREKYVEECAGARTRVSVLESKIKEMVDQVAETASIRDQLLRVLIELKAAQMELLSMESELATTRDLQLKAVAQAELMESAAEMEKDKSDTLSRQVSEQNEAILMSKLVASEAHVENCKILSSKDAEIEEAKARVAQAEEQVDDVKRELERMQELEIQLLEKSIFSDLIQLELEQSLQMLSSTDKASSEVIEEMEPDKERGVSDQAFGTESKNANEDMDILKLNIEMDEYQKIENETEAEKPESLLNNTEVENPSQTALSGKDTDQDEKDDQNEAYVIIPTEEYDLLVKKAGKADEDSDPLTLVEYTNQPKDRDELEMLKKKLEAAMAKIGELRDRVEQAVTRADAAEKAKTGLEDQVRRYQEHIKMKKAASDALKEASAPQPHNFPTYEKIPETYQPLGKVLKMKF